MEFEKLLKEHSLRVQWTETGEAEMPMLFEGGRSATIKTGAKVIPVEDLGELALERFIEMQGYRNLVARYNFEFLESCMENTQRRSAAKILWEIAVAFLGKEKIKKRLKEKSR